MCIIVFVKNITLCKNVLHQTYLWLKSLQLSGFGASRFTVYIETTRIFVHCYRDIQLSTITSMQFVARE